MRSYFVDAWYFIARWNRFDAHHREARRLEQFVAGAVLITHDGVLGEVLTHFSATGAANRQRTAAAVRATLRDLHVEAVTRELFQRSVDLYAARPDQDYSLTDCTSMVVMRDFAIEHILTNDHHFRQEGFTVLSDAP